MNDQLIKSLSTTCYALPTFGIAPPEVDEPIEVSKPVLDVCITNHARSRICERLNIPKRAALRHAKLAFKHGKTKSRLPKRLDSIIRIREKHSTRHISIRLYKDNFYLFNRGLLITVYPAVCETY